MKQLIFVLALLLSISSAYSQKNFEGKVVYLLEADKEEKKPELTVFFSAGKIKLIFKENEEPDNKYIIVIPDSGKIYTINTYSKEYKQKKLAVTEPAGTYIAQKKTIAGQTTTSAKPAESGLGGMLGGIMSFRNVVFDVADSLIFEIPAKFANNPELMMLNNNHIVLGAQMTMGSYFTDSEEYSDSTGEVISKKITVKAMQITPMSFTADEFAIPAGYALEVRKPYDMPMADSAMIDTAIAMPDSPAAYVPAKKRAKKPVRKPTKKAPVKSAARKQ
jgi:hypothetical protein